MKEIYIRHIAGLLGLKDWQVENCADLFADGDTIPFISRYRKEKTGGMDDADVAEVRHWVDVFAEMEKRKETILGTISEAGALTDELRSKIENCVSATELEDLYLPWRPKRRTRATAARELGLEPLLYPFRPKALVDAALCLVGLQVLKHCPGMGRHPQTFDKRIVRVQRAGSRQKMQRYARQLHLSRVLVPQKDMSVVRCVLKRSPMRKPRPWPKAPDNRPEIATNYVLGLVSKIRRIYSWSDTNNLAFAL